MLNAGFRLSTYSCRYTVQECVKLGCLIDKASKLLCIWVCVTPKQKQIWSRSERSQNNVSLCVRVYAYVWSCVCREISKYYGRFCCMFTSWISVYVCASTLYVWEPPPPKDLQRFITCCTYTYLSPWRHARSLVHNKHAHTASGEHVCDLEGDNSVARPHRRQLSTE